MRQDGPKYLFRKSAPERTSMQSDFSWGALGSSKKRRDIVRLINICFKYEASGSSCEQTMSNSDESQTAIGQTATNCDKTTGHDELRWQQASWPNTLDEGTVNEECLMPKEHHGGAWRELEGAAEKRDATWSILSFRWGNVFSIVFSYVEALVECVNAQITLYTRNCISTPDFLNLAQKVVQIEASLFGNDWTNEYKPKQWKACVSIVSIQYITNNQND